MLPGRPRPKSAVGSMQKHESLYPRSASTSRIRPTSAHISSKFTAQSQVVSEYGEFSSEQFKHSKEQIPGYQGFVPGLVNVHAHGFGEATRIAMNQPKFYLRPTSAYNVNPYHTDATFHKPVIPEPPNPRIHVTVIPDRQDAQDPSLRLFQNVTQAHNMGTDSISTDPHMSSLRHQKKTIQSLGTERYDTVLNVPVYDEGGALVALAQGPIKPSRTQIPGYGGHIPDKRDEDATVNPFHKTGDIKPMVVINQSKEADFKTDLPSIYRFVERAITDNPTLAGNFQKNRLRNMSSWFEGDRGHLRQFDPRTTYNETYLPHYVARHTRWAGPRPLLVDKSREEIQNLYRSAIRRVGIKHIRNCEMMIKETVRYKTSAGAFELRNSKAVKKYDKDSTGWVEMEEFVDIVREFGVDLSTVDQQLALMSRYDPQCYGRVNYFDFIDKMLVPGYTPRVGQMEPILVQ